MRCSQATRQLQLYIDNQLSWENVHPLEVHLATCGECRGELAVLEEITSALEKTQPVKEPEDLTAHIMQRVALDVQQREREQLTRESYIPLRPSLRELFAVIVLATVTTFGIILVQPSLRASLPFTSGNSQISHMLLSASQFFASVNSGTLTLVFWVLGTILGISITLALAGNDVRDEWFKAISHRLPVW